MKTTPLNPARLSCLLTNRVGNILEGFYCGYSAPSVAHYLVYMELRRDRVARPKVTEHPYFTEWRSLRKEMCSKEDIPLAVFPHLEELRCLKIMQINGAVLMNRFEHYDTSSLRGMQAMVECASAQRNDGYTFDAFFQSVCEECDTLMNLLGLEVIDAGNQNMGKPARLDFATSAL